MGNSNSSNIPGWTQLSTNSAVLPYFPSSAQFTEFLYNLPSLKAVPRVILDIIAQYCESPINSICINSRGQILQTIPSSNFNHNEDNSNNHAVTSKTNFIYNLIHPLSSETIISTIVTPDERIIASTSGIAGDLSTGIGSIHGRIIIYDLISNRIQYELTGHSLGQCLLIRFVSLLLLPNNMFAAICKCKLLHIFKLNPKPQSIHLVQLPQHIRPRRRKSYFEFKHYYMQVLPFNRIAICVSPFNRDIKQLKGYSKSPPLKSLSAITNGENNNNVNNHTNELKLDNFSLNHVVDTETQQEESKELLASSLSHSPSLPNISPSLGHRLSAPTSKSSSSNPSFTSTFCIFDVCNEVIVGEPRTLTRDIFASDLVYIGNNKLLSSWSDGSIKEWNLNTQPDQQMTPFVYPPNFNNSNNNNNSNINSLYQSQHCHDLHSVSNRCNGLCTALPHLTTHDNRWIAICSSLHCCIHSNQLNKPPVQIQLLLENHEIRVQSAVILPNGYLCVAETHKEESADTNSNNDTIENNNNMIRLIIFDLNSFAVIRVCDFHGELYCGELIHSVHEKYPNTTAYKQ